MYVCVCVCALQLLTSISRTDHRVLAKIRELGQAGVRRATDIRQFVAQFICNELFAGHPAPSRCDARYWPSERVIRNCLYTVRKNRRFLAFVFFRIRVMVFQFTYGIQYQILSRFFDTAPWYVEEGL